MDAIKRHTFKRGDLKKFLAFLTKKKNEIYTITHLKVQVSTYFKK